MNKIYSNIRERRQELKMSQDELARLCGYSDRSMITKIEKGLVSLSYEKIYVFAKALKMNPEDLMGWEEADHSIENADALAGLMHDAKMLEHVKKLMTLDEQKKEAVYTYTNFLCSN